VQIISTKMVVFQFRFVRRSMTSDWREQKARVKEVLTVGFCHSCVQNAQAFFELQPKRSHSSTQGPTVTQIQ
jgi:hypothetical protein